MKFSLRLNKLLTILLFFTVSNLTAQTIETNIPGLVIKDYKCANTKYIDGNIINRNIEPFIGSVRVKIIDKENDIIWQRLVKINVGGQNGIGFGLEIAVGNCLPPNKVQITLER
jgi:hypothetical protein